MKRILYTIALIVGLSASAQNTIVNYAFSGNANDGGPNNANGTVSGAVLATDRFGAANSAYFFDGIDDEIIVADANYLDIGTGDFTVAFWMNSNNSTDLQQAVSKGSSTEGYQVRTDDFGRIFARVNDQFVVSNSVVTTDIWRMVTVTFDRDLEMRVYIDGVLDNTATINTASLDPTNTDNLAIGSNGAGSEYFDGSLDQVRIFDQALSAEQVATMYEEDFIFANYTFDGGTFDVTGNEHNGTATGATPTSDRFGNLDNAYFFGGSSTMTFANTANAVFAQELSVSAWINSGAYQADGVGEPEILSNGNASTGFDFKLSGGTSTEKGLKAEVFGGGGFQVAGALGLNTWYHVAFTWRRNDLLRLYVNGIEVGSTATPDQNILASTRELVAGTGTNGTIDELKIYNRTLSPAEISTLFSAEIEAQPESQPTNMVFSNNSGGCFSYDFTASSSSNVDGYLHVFNAVESPTFIPQDGVVYTPDVGTAIEGDNFISQSNSALSGNLCSQPNTTYFYKIYAYNGSGSLRNYLTENPLTAQVTTLGNPTVTSFAPNPANEGDLVTITGTNFSETASNNEVLISGQVATITGTPTNESITVTVPSGVTSGPLSVRVGVGLVTGSHLTATAPEAFTRQNPHALFTFSGNTLDDSGNGNDGTPNTGAALAPDRRGVANSAYSFDGISGSVTTADLGVMPTQLTLSTWFFFEDGNANATHQMVEIPGTAALALFEGQFQGVLNLNENFVVSTVPITAGEWHFGAMTYDGGTLSMYVDGQLVASVENADGIFYPNASNPLRMGESFGSNFFDGSLDNVQLHGRALSASEISTLFTQEVLTAQYNFDAVAAVDVTGNGYDGTAFGTNILFSVDRFGSGRSFEPQGDGNYIGITHNGDWDMRGEVTINGWVRPNAYPENAEFGHVLFRENEFGELDVAPDGTIFYHWNQNGSGNFAVLGTHEAVVELNQWSMVSLVIGSNDYVKLYVNGNRQKVSLNGGATNVDSIQITRHAGLGVSADFGDAGDITNNRWFSGSLDDFRIYAGHELSAIDIQTIYQEELSGGAFRRVAYFPFDDGSLLDASPNNYIAEFKNRNDADITPSLGTDRFGNSNGALVFDNTGNFAQVFHERSINIGQNFTVNLWVNPSSFASVTELGDVIMADANSGFARFMILHDGKLAYHYNATDGSFPFVESEPGIVDLNQWQMVTYSITNGRDVKLYLNGSVVASGSVTDQALNLSATLTMASADRVDETNTQNRFYDGSLDEVSVFQRVLADQEVADLFSENTLVANYPFNTNAFDESGNGNDLSVEGATIVADRFGNAESAYNFDGVDDYLSRAGTAFLVGLEQASVSLWVNTNSITKVQDILNTGTTRFYLNNEGRVISDLFIESGGTSASMGTVPLTADTWSHIVLTYDGSMARLYKDGTLAVENASNGKIVSVNDGTVYVGSNDGATNFMDGEIDDIKIFNHTLSTDEITALFNEGGSRANDITSFTIEGQVGNSVIDANAHSVSIDMPFGTDRTSLVPTIEVSDLATINPASGVAQDFSNIVNYIVTSEDGTEQAWQVFLSVLPNTETEIVSFGIGDAQGVIDSDGKTVTVEVANGTDVTALVATFELSSGASATIGGTPQESGTTANDFSASVTYLITAEDAVATANWVVTVNVAPADAKEILSFSVPNQQGVTSINSTAATVELDVAFGTDLTNLVADFTLSGGAVAGVDGIQQVSGTTDNDFTNPVTYVVTAINTSTKNWLVTIEVAPNTDADITVFSFDAQVSSVVDFENHTVEVTMPIGTDVTSLTPNNISVSEGATVNPPQGDARDFTNPQTYTVTAQDGVTTQDWVVTVIVLPNNAPTALNLDNSSVSENQAVGTLVGTFSTADPDGGQTFTYSLVSGSGDVNNASFSIDGDQLLTDEVLDFEDATFGGSRSILVETNDGNGGTLRQSFTITVDDIANENTDSQFSEFNTPTSQVSGGQDVQVSVTVTDEQGLKRVNIHYTPIGSSSVTIAEMTENAEVSGSYSFSIPNARLNDFGVEYFFQAIDQLDNTTDSETFTTVRVVAEASETLPSSSVRPGTTVQDYRIVAFPYQGLPISDLTDDLGPTNDANWRLLRYEGATSAPFYRSASGQLNAGVGYWLIFRGYDGDASSIDVGGTSVALDQGVFKIDLRAGLNLIGNPFKGSINWASVLQHNENRGIISNGDVSSAAGYNGDYVTRTSLNAFEGAFVNSSGAVTDFEIPISALSGRVENDDQTLPREAFLDDANWSLRFFLETPTYSYKMGSIGMNVHALDKSDKYDFPLLPKFSTYLEQVFEDGNTSSIKRSDYFKEWTFQLPNNLPESEINVTWDMPVSSRKTILLVDGASNKVYDLTKTRSVNIPNNPNATHRLYYGDQATIWDNIDLPFDVLYSVYPNPVENVFNLDVYTSENKSVEVELISLSGKSTSLGSISLSKGLSSLRIDLSTKELQDGIYFVRVDGQVMTKIFKK